MFDRQCFFVWPPSTQVCRRGLHVYAPLHTMSQPSAHSPSAAASMFLTLAVPLVVSSGLATLTK